MKLRYLFHKKLFDLIAPFYQLFFHSQLRTYRKYLKLYKHKLGLSPGAKILDLGCGTGAFGLAFQELGFEVIGIDSSHRMLQKANNNYLSVINVDLLTPYFPFESNSFDLVIGANVIHGFQLKEREIIYQEAARLTKKYVLFHDYSNKRNIFVSIIEWIEHGDYFNFIRQVPEDFYKIFKNVVILPNSESYSAWYLCSIS
ncbi:MAG: class I SAM-dependent methyltransferase [Promethearchaeia archaeon]|nr:MAG: class I SAM-dependent methyltransferase [Candidatus Lokiarchaeia archaeon]